MKFRIFLFSAILFSSSMTFSQTYGKIFTKDEANILYGSVIETVVLKVSDLNTIINQTQNVVMFKIINGQLIILGDGRKILSPNSIYINNSDPFALCSKNKLLELLKYGDSNQISFESRMSRATITYGMHTLEELTICPPFCN